MMVLLLSVLASAQSQPDAPPQAEGTSGLWFVELASPPAADGTSQAVLDQEKTSFRAAAARRGVRFEERYAFSSLWNGVSVRVAATDATRLASIPGVRAVYPVELAFAEPQRPEEVADLYTALAMTGADIAQASGYTGAGVTVAIIDSGLDYDHPDLGGCFGPGCRVVGGMDFVGDAYQPNPASAGYNPVPAPDPNPDDCNGHGTHVAGIVGARAASPQGITGVAPGVTFRSYRVFGCGVPVGAGVSTSTDILLAAIEAAGAAKPDVINMSIGAAFLWPQYPTAQASNRLAQMGITVVASIGNDGATGAYSASAPGVGADVIGVASFDNTHVRLPAFRISPDNAAIGYAAAAGAPPPATSGTFPVRRTGTATSTTDGCSTPTPPQPGSLTGAVALIRRGTCAFYEKAINAQAAGAVAVILYNNVAGVLNPTVVPPTDPPGLPPVAIPVVGISDTDGATIDSRIATGGPDAVTVTWTSEMTSVPMPTGGLISSFSSYGLAPDLTIKPDIGAPGGSIRSTYPLDHPAGDHGYATLSGTSMASPHTAGAVALLLEAKPGLSPARVRDILQNSADPKPWSLGPTTGLLDSVQRQGAGMLDIIGAIQATTVILPGKLSLGEVEGASVTRTLTIANIGAAPVTYALSHVAALATRGTYPGTPPPPNPLQFASAPASVAFSSGAITVATGSTASVDVTISPPAGAPTGAVFDGYLVFTATSGGAVYRVPYAGFKGDYQSIPILTPTTASFPWLAKLLPTGTFENRPNGATYSMTGDDIPFILAHFDHPSYRLRMTVQHVATGLILGRADYSDYRPRNASPTAATLFVWDGSVETGFGWLLLPDGDYRIVLSVLKPLGDNLNPAHYETWTSPVITIARPPGGSVP
jgi:subtilisin family serine protease